MMRVTLLLPLLAISLLSGACAKHNSDAERDAEIDRRVQERLEAEHQAQEKQDLAQHETALAAREKALAAQESSFASMSASLAPANAAPAGDTNAAPDQNDATDGSSSGGYSAGGALYPNAQYGYVGAGEPDLDYYPYFGLSSIPIITSVGTYGGFPYYFRRNFRGNRGWVRYPFRSGNFRGTGFMHGATRPTFTPSFSYRPSVRPATNRSMISSRRPMASRMVLQRAR